MTTQTTHTDVTSRRRRRPLRLPTAALAALPMRRAGAILTAATAGAMAVLMAAGTAAGQPVNTAYPNGLPGQPYPSKAIDPAQPMAAGQGVAAPGGAPAGAAPGAADAGMATASNGVLRLTAGHSQVVFVADDLSKVKVSIGDQDVAAINKMPPSSFMVTGKKGGTTGLVVTDDQGHTTVTDVVVEPDYSTLRQKLAEAFPGQKIDVSALNDTIGLRGIVPTVRMAEQVVEIASTYGKVHNFVEVGGGQQVMLHIRFAEVSKNAVRQLGVSFGGTDGVSAFTTTTFGGGVNTFNLTGAAGSSIFSFAPTAATLYGAGRFNGTPFDYFINALEENGLVRMLAEPNVVAINGQEGAFVAGGEIPIPVSQGGGSGAGAAVTIEYKEYGIKLNYTPLILGDGRIRLKVAPEVSQLDYANSVQANGFNVPALTKRKVSTTVELADGQSFALAGLLNDTSSATTSAIPLLGDIPILGQLFRSTSFQHQQTELVVMVTPRLVAPTNPGQMPTLPGEHWRQPTDVGVYFLHDLGGPLANSGSVEAGGPMKTTGTGPAPATPAAAAAAAPPPAYRGSYGFAPAPQTVAAAGR